METKSKRIKLSKADKYVEEQEAFGWEVVNKEDLRPDNTILLTMQRDYSQLPNAAKIKSFEKQYRKVSRPLPVTGLVLIGIGLAFLVAFFFLKSAYFFAYVFLYVAITFFCIATYALLVFLILLIKRKKIQVALMRKAAAKSGSNKDWPTPRNVLPEEDTSWMLSKSVE